MTEIAGKADAQAAAVLRSLLRRAGHELRNAQNSAAVNLEVVRSRASGGTADPDAFQPFADNAVRGLEESAAIAEGVIGLCTALVTSLSAGTLSASGSTPVTGAEIELGMSADAAERLVSNLRGLASRMAVGVEARAPGVILRVPPEYETD